ncbi:pectate lyase-like adhesive domain-containing protein, partial [Lactobacillus bombicola]|uniref:pectate lyase-like adhesive domain-containing protein n=1 Tax=Lactobacillus bombicola TaxID=1505723 RepID=UPI000E58E67F
MLGKNNFTERLRKMEMQAKQDHFSIRKLSIGAASVLLGFTFFGLTSQTTKADTINPVQTASAAPNADSADTQKAQPEADSANTQVNTNKNNATDTTASIPQTDSTKDAKSSESKTASNDKDDKTKLSTYSALQTFLKTPAKASDTQVDSSSSGQTSSATVSSTNSTNQPAISVNSDVRVSSNTPVDTPAISDQPSTSKENVIGTEDLASNAAQVHNWDELASAISNADISEIDVMNDILDAPVGGTGENTIPINFVGRNLLIKSNGNGSDRYVVDFKGNHPNVTSGILNLTFQNLVLHSADTYGVIRSDKVTNAIINFENVDFSGSQMIYIGSNTHINFKGTNTAKTVQVNGLVDNRPLLSISGSGNVIDFDGSFTGITRNDSVIVLGGNGNKIIVEPTAKVMLWPAGNTPTGGINLIPSAGINGRYGIIAAAPGDNNSIDVKGALKINVGKLDFDGINGSTDWAQAGAIYIGGKSSSLNIDSGALINVTTNGNITTYPLAANNLISINGNLNIAPNGQLSVTGQNMGKYAGTLVNIAGKADINNGSLNIKLVGNAGTGNIVLLNVPGSMNINNPTSVILDAHLNKNLGTSIVGNNGITIANARQRIDLGAISGGVITLPPLYTLQVQKGAQGAIVNLIQLLNGQKKFDLDTFQSMLQDPQISKILQLPELKGVATAIQNAATTGNTDFDGLYKTIFEKIFTDPTAVGYNNLQLIQANSSGFLDIDPSSVVVTNNPDGSRKIAGKVINYNLATDGPNSGGLLDKYIPGGTNAYIIAQYKGSKEGQLLQDPKIVSPYASTNAPDLPSKFVAKVNDDGTFEFTIPAVDAAQLAKGDAISLVPTANFVSYNPADVQAGIRPVIKDLGIVTLGDAQDKAAKEINDAIVAAKAKKPSNLTPDQSKAFDDVMTSTGADATKPVNPDHTATSVYTGDSEAEITKRKQAALDKIAVALKQSIKDSAINDVTAKANATSVAYPLQKPAIDTAKNTAINNINSVPTTGLSDTADAVQSKVNTAKENGIAAIDQAVTDYKTGIKTEINGKIDQAKQDIDSIAADPILNADEKAAIKKLKDQLSRPTEIAKDGGDIDADPNETQVEKHKKEAEDIINGINAKIDAIKKVEQAAKDQIAKHPEDSDDIKDNSNKAVDDIINGKDPDGSKGTDGINNTHAAKQQQKVADDIGKAAQAAKDRVNNSGLSTVDKKPYLDAIDAVAKAATAKPGTDGYDPSKSIYGKNTDDDINQAKIIAQNQFNKEAAKAEIAGNGKSYQDGLGIPDDKIIADTVKKEQDKIDAIADGTPATDNRTTADSVENTAKANLLAAAKEAAKAQVKAEAAKAENKDNLNALDSGIDDAVKTADTNIDSHNTIDEIKQDVINGKNDILNKYKEAAKSQIKADSDADKAALGVTTDPAIDNAVKNANTLIDNAESIDGVGKALNTSKNDVLSQFRVAAKSQVKANADQAKQDIGTGIDISGINNALNAANGKIDVDKDPATIKQDIADGKTGILEAAKSANKAKLDAYEKDIEDKIDKSGLPATEIANAKTKAKQIVNNLTDPLGYNQQIDKATDLPGVKDTYDKGKKALDALLGDLSVEQSKQQAIDDIKKAQEAAKNSIATKYPDLKPEDTKALNDKIDNAAKTGIDKIKNETDPNNIPAEHDDTINNINSVGKDADDLALSKQKADAINKLNAKAEAAKKAIDNIPADQLSPTNKEHFKDQIDADVADATNKINAADKLGVDPAEQAGEADINKDLNDADLTASRAKALQELKAEKDKDLAAIDVKADQMTPDQVKDLKQKINDIYDPAVSQIAGDQTIDTINTDKTNAINGMKGIVDSIGNSIAKNLQDAKDKAINDPDNGLDALAKKVRDHINADPNLSETEKVAFGKKIDDTLTAAKSAVNGATDEAGVKAATTAGRDNLNQIQTDADLQAAKNAAKTALLAEQDKVNTQINGLNTIDATGKKALTDKVNGFYTDAIGKVDAATTISTIDQEKKTGIDNMDNVLKDAMDLNQTIAADQAKLDSVAKDAINQINGSTLSPEDKANAQKAIENIRDQAKSDVAKQGTKDLANQVEAKGESDINAAKNNALKADLDQAKAKAKADIAEKAKAAKDRINADYNSLPKEQQNEAKAAHDKAISDIDDAVGKADADIDKADADPNPKGKIDQIVKDTINAINQAEKDANLAAAKAKAKAEIQAEADKVKPGLTNQADKDAVDTIANNAISKIDDPTMTDSAAVTTTKDKAIADIDAVKDNAGKAEADAIRKAKADAIKELDNELNGNGTAGNPGVAKQIDGLTSLTPAEKAKFKDQAQKAHDEAVANVNGSATVPDINARKNEGIT